MGTNETSIEYIDLDAIKQRIQNETLNIKDVEIDNSIAGEWTNLVNITMIESSFMRFDVLNESANFSNKSVNCLDVIREYRWRRVNITEIIEEREERGYKLEVCDRCEN